MPALTAARTQRFTHVSRHARQRIAQRCNLEEHRLTRMLDEGLYVDLGRKPGCDRRHLLFFSSPDQQAFVALRDETTGTVVTVLPLDYHEKLAWKIASTQIDQARLFAVRRTTTPPYLQMKLHYVNAQGALKTLMLLKWRPSAHGELIDGLVNDRALGRSCRAAVARLGIALTQIIRLTVRERSAGQPEEVPLSLLDE